MVYCVYNRKTSHHIIYAVFVFRVQFYINRSQEICLHVFSTVEKIIREPGLVRTAGSAVAYFYVIFSAFFEFVVLAVYVVACNSWHIAPFLSYYMCVEQSVIAGSPLRIIYNMPNFLSGKTQMPLHAAAAFKQRKEFFRRRIRLMNQEDFSSSSLIYSIPDFPEYANFCRIFCRQQKKRLTALFSNTETFFFCVFSYVLQCICLGINHLSSIHLWH